MPMDAVGARGVDPSERGDSQPGFSSGCDDAYLEIQDVGRQGSIRELVRIIQRNFRPDVIACLSMDPHAGYRHCFSSVRSAARLHHSLPEWLKITQCAKEFEKRIIQFGNTRKPFFAFEIKQQISKGTLRKEVAYLARLHQADRLAHLKKMAKTPQGIASSHLCLVFKLPRLYGDLKERSECVLCLVHDDPFDVFDQNWLSHLDGHTRSPQFEGLWTLMYTWALHMNHSRMELDRHCDALLHKSHAMSTEDRESAWQTIGNAVQSLQQLLTLPELVRIRRLSVLRLSSLPDKLPRERAHNDCLSTFLGHRLVSWKAEHPPFWPPRDDKEFEERQDAERELANVLLYWCYWRDIQVEQITSLRRCRHCIPGHEPCTQLLVPDEQASACVLRRPSCYEMCAAYVYLPRALAELSDQARHRIQTPGPNPTAGCTLRSKSLLCFFLASALLLDKKQEDYWLSAAPSDEDVASSLGHVATVAHHLLGGLPIDEPTIRGISWLLFEYAHRQLGVPERIDILHHLSQAARTEPTLHVLKRFYRDHFFHALEVCFLGHFLLELEIKSETGTKTRLWENVARVLGCRGDKVQVLRLWYLAALTHDIGYGVDVLKGVRKLFDFFANDASLKTFSEQLGNSLVALSTALAGARFLDLTADDKPGEDHGVIGARHLKSLLETIAKDDSSLNVDDYEPAVRAIGLHNFRGTTPVRFKENPLAFLLILCDTIQEWNRPRLSFNTAPLEILAWMRDADVQMHDINGPLEHLQLNVKWTKNKKNGGRFQLDAASGGPARLHVKLQFNDDINRNDQVFYLWLDASSNLQRLDPDGLGLDVDIEYVTPLLKSPRGTVQQQFYRLRDAARDTHMGFLEKWFPHQPLASGGGVTNGAVTYTSEFGPSHPNPQERLTLHLRQLTQTRRITKTMDDFLEALKRWKRYPENLEFPGDYGLPDRPT